MLFLDFFKNFIPPVSEHLEEKSNKHAEVTIQMHCSLVVFFVRSSSSLNLLTSLTVYFTRNFEFRLVHLLPLCY